MNLIKNVLLLLSALVFICCANAEDWRNIENGYEIPSEGYADQPYIVKTDDGAWLCILTTGAGIEGEGGQHVVSTRSVDQGKTWSPLVDVEPADGPEASYAVLLKVPYGRVYAFYNHNTDNIRKVKANNPPYKDGYCRRVDSLGYFVFKYSDDDGLSWSHQRYVVPVREMKIDRQNAYQGKIRFFWNVGKPFISRGAGFTTLHKVGGFGKNFFTRNEGVLLKSNNILFEKDPEKLHWQTLPDGDFGLRTPPGGGPISAEQSVSVLSDGSFYCVYRSVDGHPVFTYSRDQGHTWDMPQYQRYADGRLMKHPRAANFAWRCSNGKYLYWFHNHGGKSYADRNPAWLCGGVETDSPQGKIIQWSQPEIVLYDDNPSVRMSYPDLVEENGEYFLTETQKEIARIHQIDTALINGLWNQFDAHEITRDGLILNLTQKDGSLKNTIKAPMLPLLNDASKVGNGMSIDVWLQMSSPSNQQMILGNQTKAGRGFRLQTTEQGTIELVLNDGRAESRWDCDQGMLKTNKLRHVVMNIDAGAKIITFIVDGKLCDGGEFRQFGWGRFDPALLDVNGADVIRLGENSDGAIKSLRIYNRCLTTSEAIANYRHGFAR